MICKSDHSDIQLVTRTEFAPPSGEGNDWWWSYVSQGIGYVAISLAVMGELVGAHEMAVVIVSEAARVGGTGGHRRRRVRRGRSRGRGKGRRRRQEQSSEEEIDPDQEC